MDAVVAGGGVVGGGAWSFLGDVAEPCPACVNRRTASGACGVLKPIMIRDVVVGDGVAGGAETLVHPTATRCTVGHAGQRQVVHGAG